MSLLRDILRQYWANLLAIGVFVCAAMRYCGLNAAFALNSHIEWILLRSSVWSCSLAAKNGRNGRTTSICSLQMDSDAPLVHSPGWRQPAGLLHGRIVSSVREPLRPALSRHAYPQQQDSLRAWAAKSSRPCHYGEV